MQNHNLPLISISRENYIVPKGEEHLVHYKSERVLFGNNGMTRLSHPDLIKTPVKMFDEVKRNLELQGYTIEIVWHPEGKYSNTRIPKDAATEIAEKDAKIKALEAELAKVKSEAKEENATENKEANEETAEVGETENAESEAEPAPAKKGGRPKKSA